MPTRRGQEPAERRGHGRIIIDTRWLGIGGSGRVTELLLRGVLAAGATRHNWATWNGSAVTPLGPDSLGPAPHDPRRRFGQRGTARLPRAKGGLLVFMHQNRPLLAPRNITVIHDTIQVMTTTGAGHAARLAFLRRIAATSAHIVTVSEWSRAQIIDQLGAAPDQVTAIHNAVDPEVAARVRALRAQDGVASPPTAIYVGRFAAYKNLPMLVRAFRGSRFAREGGRLALIGGRADEAASLRDACPDLRGVDIIGSCPQPELERWYARATFLVQPSMLEGFGLPVAEALAAGIPVCASSGGALPEVARGQALLFDATRQDAIAAAIDATAERAAGAGRETEARAAEDYLATANDPVGYARAFEAMLIRFGRTARQPAPIEAADGADPQPTIS